VVPSDLKLKNYLLMKNLNETTVKSPFKVPENYFEEVNRKIISATSGKEAELKKVSLFKMLKPYLAAAAVISGLIILSYSSLKLINSNNTVDKVPQISLQEFSETYLNDIDINTLEEIASSYPVSNERDEISNSDIIDYLIYDNIDIDEIYETQIN
jgi:hypothetical protein